MFIAAAAITTDGSMIVGRLDINNTVGGIVWDRTEVVSSNGLPLLAAVSGDGSVIVTSILRGSGIEPRVCAT